MTKRNLARLYTLNPFEQDTIAEDSFTFEGDVFMRTVRALRVPGGWIFKFSESTVYRSGVVTADLAFNQFIPYSEEWNENNIIQGAKF
jgi:hypothetical protein